MTPFSPWLSHGWLTVGLILPCLPLMAAASPGSNSPAPAADALVSEAPRIERIEILLARAPHAADAVSAGTRGLWLAPGLSVADPSRFATAVAAFLGQSPDEARLDALGDAVVRVYAAADRPVTLTEVRLKCTAGGPPAVSLLTGGPPVVHSGVDGGLNLILADEDVSAPRASTGETDVLCVRVLVHEGHIGTVSLCGVAADRGRRIGAALADLAGAPLTGARLQGALEWLNRNPTHPATLRVTPGASAEVADVEFQLQPQRAWRLFSSYANDGMEPLGRDRWQLGAQWGDAFARDHRLTASMTVGEDPAAFASGFLDWRLPLPPIPAGPQRHELSLSGALAQTRAEIDHEGTPLDIQGHVTQLSAQYRLPGKPAARWSVEPFLGVDAKSFDTDLTFGGEGLPHRSTTVLSGTVGLDSHYQGNGWSLESTAEAARGRLDAPVSESTEPQSTAEDDFWLSRLRLRATVELPQGWALQLRSEGQWASTDLAASEELSLTGHDTVRGYAERSLRADRGAWASAELRTPVWHGTAPQLATVPGAAHSTATPLAAQLVIFAETGWAESAPSAAAGAALSTRLPWAVGIGCRLQASRHLALHCDLALPLSGEPLTPRLHLQASLTF
jgi:hemolysin activation/secretion protein